MPYDIDVIKGVRLTCSRDIGSAADLVRVAPGFLTLRSTEPFLQREVFHLENSALFSYLHLVLYPYVVELLTRRHDSLDNLSPTFQHDGTGWD